MEHRKLQFAPATVVLLILFCWAAARAQITPNADSYTNSATPTTNYGAKTLLDVDAASQITYIRFDLSSIPAVASVSQATLKLFVNSVTTAGSFNVDYINGSWAENTINFSNAPALGTTIVSNVPVTTASKNQYLLIDVTAAVQAWLNGSQANDGLALVANSSFNATFDSKENTTTSHAAELDVVYAGIAGVQTANGSGLMGGGMSGTLNLSLINTCAANQLLEWNGSNWACSSAGTGTITGVTAGTDLTGGGNSGNVTLNVDTTKVVTGVLAGTDLTGGGTGGVQTLNLDTTKVPQLAAANTFTGNQTVNGNLSATGVISGNSYQIGSDLFAFGSHANGNAFLGFAGQFAQGTSNTASGFLALDNATGCCNTASGTVALYENGTGTYNTASGDQALYYNATGNYNTASGYFSGGPLDFSYITGSNNTFLGASTALSTGTLSNATAIGANAEVAESNAMVLGSIKGVNSASSDTLVGIGTTAPTNPLTVVSSSTYIPVEIQGPSTFGTWLALSNTSPGGKTWNFLSAGSGNAEGAGNLGITSLSGGTIYLEGNVAISGNLSKSGGSFQIDHPLDPANKYLYHSFVESPDMKNIYDGNVTTDKRGLATVVLPDYFEALNRDFRYQLTVIGQFAQAIVARKIEHNRFVIRTSKPGVEVSWQVTGIRQDAYANAHRIPVEEDKTVSERGRYLHPELFGAPRELSIGMENSSVVASRASTSAARERVGEAH